MADDGTTIDALCAAVQAENELLAAQAAWLEQRRQLEEHHRAHRSTRFHALRRSSDIGARVDVARRVI